MNTKPVNVADTTDTMRVMIEKTLKKQVESKKAREFSYRNPDWMKNCRENLIALGLIKPLVEAGGSNA
jgi:hypothetical protein